MIYRIIHCFSESVSIFAEALGAVLYPAELSGARSISRRAVIYVLSRDDGSAHARRSEPRAECEMSCRKNYE